MELLALSFRYPEERLAEALVAGEWADAARELASVFGIALPADFGQVICDDAEGAAFPSSAAAFKALRAEATRLLVGAPKSVVPSYEGLWRAAEDGVEPVHFVNPHTMDVERFMRSCGLGQPEGTNEPLDYIATELEFMQFLCLVEAGNASVADAAVAPGDYPGGSAAAAYEIFMKEHALAWIPAYAGAVRDEARLPFYRAAAQLLRAYFSEA